MACSQVIGIFSASNMLKSTHKIRLWMKRSQHRNDSGGKGELLSSEKHMLPFDSAQNFSTFFVFPFSIKRQALLEMSLLPPS